MKLHIPKDWLQRRVEKYGEDSIEDPPCGLIACSPEIYSEMMKMTTKVKIELVQDHVPVVVEINGKEVAVLFRVGQSYEDYVHSAQNIVVREMTTSELHVRS